MFFAFAQSHLHGRTRIHKDGEWPTTILALSTAINTGLPLVVGTTWSAWPQRHHQHSVQSPPSTRKQCSAWTYKLIWCRPRARRRRRCLECRLVAGTLWCVRHFPKDHLLLSNPSPCRTEMPYFLPRDTSQQALILFPVQDPSPLPSASVANRKSPFEPLPRKLSQYSGTTFRNFEFFSDGC